INSEGVTRNFYSGDALPLWHEELEPQNSLLDLLSSSSGLDPMSNGRKQASTAGGSTFYTMSVSRAVKGFQEMIFGKVRANLHISNIGAAAGLIWKNTTSKISIQAHCLNFLRGKNLDAADTIYKFPEMPVGTKASV
ncbi:proteasome endopeptidase complex, partial [Sarracenia purpurea var. burkii]